MIIPDPRGMIDGYSISRIFKTFHQREGVFLVMNGQEEPKETVTEVLQTCYRTISANDATRRCCIKQFCMAYIPFDPTNPEQGGICGAIYRGLVE